MSRGARIGGDPRMDKNNIYSRTGLRETQIKLYFFIPVQASYGKRRVYSFCCPRFTRYSLGERPLYFLNSLEK